MLTLLLDLNIEFQNDERTTRATYDALRQQYPNAATFDDLLARGLLRVVWGRVHSALGVSDALRRVTDDTRAAVRPILMRGDQRRFAAGPVASQAPELAPVIGEMQRAPQDLHHLQCATPSWLIARVWDRTPPHLSPRERLRFWLDRCGLLPVCYLAPGAIWDEGTADAFREAAFDVLASDTGLLPWEEFRQRLIARSIGFSGGEKPDIERYVGSIPETYVDRYIWLNGRDWERINDALDTCGDLWHVTNFLLCDIDDTDHSAAPHPIAQRLFELAALRPELLEFVTLRLRDMPRVLADMLLEPPLAALSCMLIANWTSPGGAWDRELRDRDDRTARVIAFTDAIAVVSYFAEQQSLPAAEVAALFSWLHGQAIARPYMAHEKPRVDDQMLHAARSELVRLPPETLQAIAEACVTSARPTGLGSPSFAAALDLVALGMLTDVLAPELFVTPYVQSVRSGTHSLSANGITSKSAGALIRLAQRSAPERWTEFLWPLNIRALLAKGHEPGANRFEVRDEVARSLRAHVRILCRAIISWDGTEPPELIEALVRAIRSSAVSHEEKGRVAAFSAHFESGPAGTQSERPIAADLSETLVCLDEPNREQVLAAILETDEPLMLAQLVAGAPHSLRERIRNRIKAVTPADAGEVSSLTDMHARIEALLEAGCTEAASGFIAAERDLKTFGRVPGRELARLRMSMRLWLLQGDFASITSASIPLGVEENETLEAERVVAFYKSLAELWRPEGDLEAAETGFEHLHRGHPEVPAYAINLFAARVNRLLAGNLFGQLRGESIAQARQTLTDADGAVHRWVGASDDDLAAFNCNSALLLLAVGQPERAYDVLEGTYSSKGRDRIAAYSAVALSRMGRGGDASEALRAANILFGETDDLRAARAQVQRQTPFEDRATTVLVDNPVGRIKEALFTLQQMDAIRQADVLSDSPEGFDGLVTSHVRAAATSVVALVPMMKGVELDSCEDDLTALLQAVLAARLEFFGWSLPDQSKGGFSAKGNPGERDLVLQKGSIILSVLEAVVCDRPANHEWTKKELTSHFQKLLGYSNCRLFFHLTYSYIAEPSAVMDELRRIAQSECPAGFSFIRLQDLPPIGSAPTGFWATYASSLGDVKVVFLLLDMQQQPQRDAAVAALQNNPRRKRTSVNPDDAAGGDSQ